MLPTSDAKSWLKTLPNQLSLLRIAAVPLLLLVYGFGPGFYLLSGWVFALAALTDLLDGFVARRYNAVSPLGALLDQIADKMLVATALILLVSSQVVPAYLAALLISRDIAVNGIRLMALEQRCNIAVSDFGKWKTALQLLGITSLLVNRPLLGLPLPELGQIALWLGAALAVYSAWGYVSGYLHQPQRR